MSRVLVFGGRNYNNRAAVFSCLDTLHSTLGITVVITGTARGADSLGREWAVARGVLVEEYPAQWKYGRSAGPRRNQQMIDLGKPDCAVGFPGGRGTADMIRRLQRAGVQLLDGEEPKP